MAMTSLSSPSVSEVFVAADSRLSRPSGLVRAHVALTPRATPARPSASSASGGELCSRPRGRRDWRRWATADPAQTEGEAEAEEKEAPPAEDAAEAAAAAAAAPEPEAEAPGPLAQAQDPVAALKAAFASGEEAAQAQAEALVRNLQTDRDSLVQTLGSVEEEISKSKDRFLRLNADFDNFRKRSEREKLALTSMVRGEVVEALLPMVDSFERAKTALKLESEGEQRIDASYQGIYKQFVEVMKAFGVSVVETVGKEFNPEFHEAIMREESSEFFDGVVSMEFRKGFVIGEKLLRPAMVKVSTGPGPSADAGEEGPISEGDMSSEE